MGVAGNDGMCPTELFTCTKMPRLENKCHLVDSRLEHEITLRHFAIRLSPWGRGVASIPYPSLTPYLSLFRRIHDQILREEAGDVESLGHFVSVPAALVGTSQS